MSIARGDMRKAKINVTEEQRTHQDRDSSQRAMGTIGSTLITRKGWKEGDGFPRRGHG